MRRDSVRSLPRGTSEVVLDTSIAPRRIPNVEGLDMTVADDGEKTWIRPSCAERPRPADEPPSRRPVAGQPRVVGGLRIQVPEAPPRIADVQTTVGLPVRPLGISMGKEPEGGRQASLPPRL